MAGAWWPNCPTAIDALGGGNVIAFVAETVGGATQGAVMPVTGLPARRARAVQLATASC